MIKEVDFSFYQLITEDILLDILIELFKSKRLKIPCLNVISHSDGGGFINKLYIVCNCGNCDLKISIRRNSIRDSWKLHESSNLKNYECRCVQIIDTGLNTKPTVDLKLNDRIGNEATEPLLKKQCIDITCESAEALPKNTKVSRNNKFVDLESAFTNAKITFDSQEMHSNNDAKNKIFSYFANLSYIENDFLNDSKHLNANDVLLNNYNKLMSNYKISNQEEEGVVSKEIRNGYYDFFSTFEFKIPDFGSSIEYIRSLLLPKLISNNIIRDFKINIIPQKPKSRAVFIGCNCQLRMKYSKTSSSTYKLDESFDNCFVCECMEGDCFKRIKTTSDIQYYLEKKDTVQETENSSPDIYD
ncbi:hypothetical protein ACO0SA_001031 [Hanseniaspora valbyensis]